MRPETIIEMGEWPLLSVVRTSLSKYLPGVCLVLVISSSYAGTPDFSASLSSYLNPVPFTARTLLILKGFSVLGIMVTVFEISSPAFPFKKTLSGRTTANVFTSPETFSRNCFFAGSFVRTRALLLSLRPP